MTTPPYIDPDSVAVIGFGDEVPSSWFGTVRDDLEFLARRPGVIATWSGSQAIPSSTTSTIINFTGTDERDTDGFHSPSNDPDKFTVPSGLGGWYRVAVSVRMQANGAGIRDLVLRVNGSSASPTSLFRLPAIAGADMFWQLTETYHLNAGDFVQAAVAQTSGTSLALSRARLEMVLEALA